MQVTVTGYAFLDMFDVSFTESPADGRINAIEKYYY